MILPDKIVILLFFSMALALACNAPKQSSVMPDLHLGLGTIVGELSDSSAILQTRLCKYPSPLNGLLPGQKGYVKFLLSSSPSFKPLDWESAWMAARPENDFIGKTKVKGLQAGQKYYYQALYGPDSTHYESSSIGSFRTNPGSESTAPVSFVVVTGMNYYKFHFGTYDGTTRYKGPDRDQGYPALETIQKLAPDYFIGTGDNVYFDHPAERGYLNAQEKGQAPLPGYFDGKAVRDETGMRQKYHLQFSQPRFKSLFQTLGTYWEKDDHDYRINDSDPFTDFPISHELGIKNFREQLPVTDPQDDNSVTYRSFRLNKDLQIWLVEGRDYRSANGSPDGPEKTIWGATQKAWLKKSLLESKATFKLLISPTPMVGPDDAYKKDNHVNQKGFRHEGDAFFDWLKANDFLQKNFYLICGDRHWQYHARHPSGFEEFSCGALVDNNSRPGRLSGDPKSTDPDKLIEQLYVQGTPEQATGGFLKVDIQRQDDIPILSFNFYDEKGNLLYSHQKTKE